MLDQAEAGLVDRTDRLAEFPGCTIAFLYHVRYRAYLREPGVRRDHEAGPARLPGGLGQEPAAERVRLEGAGIKPDQLSPLKRSDIYSRRDRAFELAKEFLAKT